MLNVKLYCYLYKNSELKHKRHEIPHIRYHRRGICCCHYLIFESLPIYIYGVCVWICLYRDLLTERSHSLYKELPLALKVTQHITCLWHISLSLYIYIYIYIRYIYNIYIYYIYIYIIYIYMYRCTTCGTLNAEYCNGKLWLTSAWSSG